MAVIIAGTGVVLIPQPGGVPGPAGPAGTGSTIGVKNQGALLATTFQTVDFVGSGVVASGTGTNVTVTIPGSIGVKDEGSLLNAAVQTLNFVGAGVTATYASGTATITISSSGGGGFGVIDLGDPANGVVADDSTVNSAAAVEALIAAVSGTSGVDLKPWRGIARFDRDILWNNRPVRFVGHGKGGYSGSTPIGGTVLKVPTGYAGIAVKPGAGLSELESFSVAQYGSALADGVASYNPASPTTITVSSGAAGFLNRHVVWLHGGGPSTPILDRTIATSTSSNVATVTNTAPVFIGNPAVHIGMPIAIPGAGPAGATLNAFVGAWTTTTITLVDSAGASVTPSVAVTGQQYTVKWPLIAQIQSGGGTGTLTIDNPGFQTQNVTNGRLSHAPPSIYATTTCHIRNVQASMGTQGGGVYLRGTTADGSNVDGSTLENVQMLSTRYGLAISGTDAQVITTEGCDFAGPEVSLLDMGFLGTQHIGAHFAFNTGPVVTYSGAITTVAFSYMEDGTSWVALSNGRATFVHTRNGLPYSGWNGVYSIATDTYFRNIIAEGGRFSKGFSVTGSGNGTGSYLSGSINSASSIPGATGKGWLVGTDGTDCYLVAQAAPGGAYAIGHIEVLDELRISNVAGFSGWNLGRFISGNFELKTAKGVIIGGNQIITDRKTGWTADTGTAKRTANATYAPGTTLTFSATYVQAELTAVGTRLAAIEAALRDCTQTQKALKDDFISHGAIGA